MVQYFPRPGIPWFMRPCQPYSTSIHLCILVIFLFFPPCLTIHRLSTPYFHIPWTFFLNNTTSFLVLCKQRRSLAESWPWEELWVFCRRSPHLPAGHEGHYETAAPSPSSWRLLAHSDSPRYSHTEGELRFAISSDPNLTDVCLMCMKIVITFADVSRAARIPLSFAKLQDSSNRTSRSFSKSHLLPRMKQMGN